MTISERLFSIMEEKEVTQYRLSKLTGISLQTINDWKKKNTNPGADKIMVICESLGITPEELLVGSKPDYVVDTSSVSTDESLLLESYRQLPNGLQKRLIAYLTMLSNTKGNK